jgi:hypothetical protein
LADEIPFLGVLLKRESDIEMLSPRRPQVQSRGR